MERKTKLAWLHYRSLLAGHWWQSSLREMTIDTAWLGCTVPTVAQCCPCHYLCASVGASAGCGAGVQVVPWLGPADWLHPLSPRCSLAWPGVPGPQHKGRLWHNLLYVMGTLNLSSLFPMFSTDTSQLYSTLLFAFYDGSLEFWEGGRLLQGSQFSGILFMYILNTCSVQILYNV